MHHHDMNKITWTSTFSVGFPPIDDQHKAIIKLYNDLSDTVSDQAVITAENTLGRYVDEHFAFEHQLMVAHKYPRVNAHIADHNRLKSMYEMIQGRDNNKSTILKIVVYKWFVEHVVNDSMDKHLGAFLSKTSA